MKDSAQLEINVKDSVVKHIQDSFIFSEDDEKLFQKLLKLRASINNAFTAKFKIEMMKDIIQNSEVVKFTSPHDAIIDKNIPVFRISVKINEHHLEEFSASSKVREYISKKLSPTEQDDPQSLNELTHIRSQILSREIFDKYLDRLVDAFEKHFQDDSKLKEQYDELYDEIFEVMPEKQVKEFICSGIFHVRFYQNSLNNGQFEFIF